MEKIHEFSGGVDPKEKPASNGRGHLSKYSPAPPTPPPPLPPQSGESEALRGWQAGGEEPCQVS